MLSLFPSVRIRGAILVVLVAGCVRTRVTGFDPSATFDRRSPPERIRFYDSSRPTCAYKEVGRVTSERRLFASWSKVIHQARQKAHEMGGDAVVSVSERTRISGAVVSKGGISTSETTAFSGTVIRFTDPNCRE